MAENITISNNESPLGIIGNEQRRQHLQITELQRYNPENEYRNGNGGTYVGFGDYATPDAGNQTDYLAGFQRMGHGYDSMDYKNVEVTGCDIQARRTMMDRCRYNNEKPYQTPDTSAARAAGLYDTSRPYSRIAYTCPIG